MLYSSVSTPAVWSLLSISSEWGSLISRPMCFLRGLNMTRLNVPKSYLEAWTNPRDEVGFITSD